MGFVGKEPAQAALSSDDITDGAIVNADINASAAIAMSKTAFSAGTGVTLSTNTLNVDASQAITALTGGDLTIYDDANNADVSLSMGTSATEALIIQVLNGGSNKTAEEVHFSTATASGTANHGKMVFDVDGSDIVTIDDDGLAATITTASQPNITTLAGLTTIGAVANALAMTFSDVTLFHDANNADTSFSIGTSATEALKIEVLNGSSNKTAEAVHFSTATASGTADHGSMVFDVDGTDILTIDDGGLVIKTTGTIGPVGDEDLITLTASGNIVTVAGELSVTTLDIGGTNVTATAAELNLLDGDTSVGGSITLADGDGFVVNDGGTMKTIPASDVSSYAGGGASAGQALAYSLIFGMQ